VTRCHFALRRFALTIVVALLTLSASDVSGLISISRARIDQGARRHRKPGASVTRSPRDIRRLAFDVEEVPRVTLAPNE
jgi:hypothetical protein